MPDPTTAVAGPTVPDAPTDGHGGPELALRSVEVTYNRIAIAVQGISLTLPAGKIVALLGANGAGKTTTLRAISGFLPSDAAAVTDGSVRYGDDDLTGKEPHEIARRGIVLIPERDKVFTTLSVADNLRMVPTPRHRGDPQATTALVDELFPILRARLRQQAGYLSGGERQMLAIAQALMLEPTVLLADELSLGLAPALVWRILDAIREINRKRGTAVLLVEQNAAAAFQIADYVYVLETGRLVLEGTPGELQENADVQRFYLGTTGADGGRSYAHVVRSRRKRRRA